MKTLGMVVISIGMMALGFLLGNQSNSQVASSGLEVETLEAEGASGGGYGSAPQQGGLPEVNPPSATPAPTGLPEVTQPPATEVAEVADPARTVMVYPANNQDASLILEAVHDIYPECAAAQTGVYLLTIDGMDWINVRSVPTFDENVIQGQLKRGTQVTITARGGEGCRFGLFENNIIGQWSWVVIEGPYATACSNCAQNQIDGTNWQTQIVAATTTDGQGGGTAVEVSAGTTAVDVFAYATTVWTAGQDPTGACRNQFVSLDIYSGEAATVRTMGPQASLNVRYQPGSASGDAGIKLKWGYNNFVQLAPDSQGRIAAIVGSEPSNYQCWVHAVDPKWPDDGYGWVAASQLAFDWFYIGSTASCGVTELYNPEGVSVNLGQEAYAQGFTIVLPYTDAGANPAGALVLNPGDRIPERSTVWYGFECREAAVNDAANAFKRPVESF